MCVLLGLLGALLLMYLDRRVNCSKEEEVMAYIVYPNYGVGGY